MLRPRILKSMLNSQCLRFLSTEVATSTTPAPLLTKVRADLKAAMRAKDSVRLDVLRGLIADTTNASKTSRPVTNDSHMIQMIRKRMNASQDAAKEALNAKRSDLAEKEELQISILQSYMGNSNMISGDEIKNVVQQSIARLRSADKKIDKGALMKVLVGPGGSLEGRPVDRKEVADIVNGML